MKLTNYEDIYVLTIHKEDTGNRFDFFVTNPTIVPLKKYNVVTEVKHKKKTYKLHTTYELSHADESRIKENFIVQLFNLEQESEEE